MKLTRNTIILLVALGVIVIIAGFVIFNAMSNGPTTGEVLSEDGEIPTADEVVFLNLASQISSIKFDASFFDDPRFMSLVDIRVAVVPEPIGRPDPFANVSGIVPTQ